jgi:hypothetical protein
MSGQLRRILRSISPAIKVAVVNEDEGRTIIKGTLNEVYSFIAKFWPWDRVRD